ncbi:S66 family peptidase [Liquorilactobacillus capillatus]|uniref:Microcin immunity protein n=1 Tax=Liquorilactobacillus capillatus DSM 19910 TaxID=1423731 RepID=A0A0R1MA78_9LACO|nr:S66 peptidase family protein [Liquorilactobacillus capillatus]KRL01099.1 microcin immunity protein [Liquorilactobacillus capillatus DSM 19910]
MSKEDKAARLTIGYYSASTPITAISPLRFERAKKYLTKKNIQLVAGSLTGKQDYYRSGSILERAQEINELIHNADVDVIMATIGGTNTNAVLPYIDYAYLQQHPKTFVGYSDATALLLAVKSQAPSCRVLYGPALVASFGEWPPFVDQTWAAFIKILTNNCQTVTLNAPAYWADEALNWNEYQRAKKQLKNKWGYTGRREGKLSGKIIGGNLNTIYGIIASKYFPKLHSDDLLFIEDAEKDAATVEKNFAMLKNAGVFDIVKGIVLGKHALFDDCGSNRTPLVILKEVLDGQDLPIIYGYDCCHTVPMLTTPLGARAEFDLSAQTVTFSNY